MTDAQENNRNKRKRKREEVDIVKEALFDALTEFEQEQEEGEDFNDKADIIQQVREELTNQFGTATTTVQRFTFAKNQLSQLKTRISKLQKEILEVKTKRSRVQHEIYELEVANHYNVQNRFEIEGIHATLMDVDSLVFEKQLHLDKQKKQQEEEEQEKQPELNSNNSSNSSSSNENSRKFIRTDPHESLTATVNTEAILLTLESTFSAIKHLSETRDLLQTFSEAIDKTSNNGSNRKIV